jgi:hypothetical protein
MDKEIADRLDRIEKMVSDNNRMLSKMRKSQKNAAYWRIVYWLIIIGITIASLYFVVPYLSQLGASYGIGSSTTGSTASPSTLSSAEALLKQYETTQKTSQ